MFPSHLPPPSILFRIDRRRPASWIALALGAAAAACARAASGEGASAAGLAAWGLAVAGAVAAIGDLPLPLCPPIAVGTGGRAWAAAWAVERTLWPLVGLCLAAVGADAAACVGWPLPGLLLAAATVLGARLCNAKAADAASLAIVLAALAVVPAAAVDPRLSPAVCGGAAAALAWAWSRAVAATTDPLRGEADGPAAAGPAGPVDSEFVRGDPLPASGILRRTLLWLAMATALLMMAGWLVLEHGAEAGGRGAGARLPVFAAAWGLAALAWFAGLAVPQATLQDGLAGSAGLERLLAATAGRSVAGRPAWRAWFERPGPGRNACAVALVHAVVLGWPPLVGGVVAASSWSRGGPPLAVVLLLVSAAVVLATIAAAGFRLAVARETTFAAALAAMVVLLAAWVHVSAEKPRHEATGGWGDWVVSGCGERPLPAKLRGSGREIGPETR